MKNLTDLRESLKDLNLPKYRFKQIINNVCQNFRTDLNNFTDLPIDLREKLATRLKILTVTPIKEQTSKAGDTTKVLFQTEDGQKIESVLMRFQDGRNSLCISCQAGCQMGCRFCATGKLGLLKHLTYQEIFDQVLYFSQILHQEDQSISNIVFMGMGEPFMNYQETIKAASLISDPDYLNIGARKITISTSGVVPRIYDLAKEPKQFSLAISLHAPDQPTREKIMPIAKRWPIDQLMQAARDYIKTTHRRISYEYVMLKGVNDTEEQAHLLAQLLQKQLCHVNLIPFNPTDSEYLSSQKSAIRQFRDILIQAGVNTTIRVTMGQDIDAACGQLANKS